MLGRKKYQRYLVAEVARAIGLVLLAFITIFMFFDFLGEVRNVGKGGYELSHAFMLMLLWVPGNAFELIPIAVLIGTLSALSNLARHSELTVLRASGVSTSGLLMTVLRLAMLFAALTFLIGEFVLPHSDRLAQELRVRLRDKVVAQQNFRTGIWVKDGRRYINVTSISPAMVLSKLRVYEFNEANELRSVMSAERGEYVEGREWRLSDVERTVLTGEKSRVERVDREAWESSLNPELLSTLMVTPERMSLPRLIAYVQHLRENRQNTERYEIAIWKKIVYPLSALVMVALALPFGYSHNRMSGASLKIFGGVMIGILFYLLNGVFSNLGVINAWPPLASAFAPSALFLLAALIMIWWVERR